MSWWENTAFKKFKLNALATGDLGYYLGDENGIPTHNFKIFKELYNVFQARDIQGSSACVWKLSRGRSPENLGLLSSVESKYKTKKEFKKMAPKPKGVAKSFLIQTNEDFQNLPIAPPDYIRYGSTDMALSVWRSYPEYWRDAGAWGIKFYFQDGKFYAEDGTELIEITREQWAESNRGYI
jgi:hypothetical protein